MSDEEKRAIEVLKMMTFDINDLCKECQYKDMDIEEHNCIGCREDACEIVLNIVNRQQKEIEDLKNNELDYTTIYINGVYEGKKYYKDKIREWLDRFDIEEDLQDKYDELLGSEAISKFLKQLLKEN